MHLSVSIFMSFPGTLIGISGLSSFPVQSESSLIIFITFTSRKVIFNYAEREKKLPTCCLCRHKLFLAYCAGIWRAGMSVCLWCISMSVCMFRCLYIHLYIQICWYICTSISTFIYLSVHCSVTCTVNCIVYLVFMLSFTDWTLTLHVGS